MAVDMVAMVAVMVATGVVATDTARGRLRLSPDAVMAAMVATGVVVTDTARGLLMPSLRLMPLLRLVTDTDVDTARGRLRLSPATAMAAMDADMAAMVATGVAATDTARGRLRPSPATAMAVMAAAMVAMAVTAVAMAATGVSYHRGRPSPATAMAVAMAATGVSYHRRRRSELSQKQNHPKIVIVEAVKTRKRNILARAVLGPR